MSEVKFYKYHGLGNDFIIFDPEIQPKDFSKEQVVKLCDRNFGIGADGMLFVGNSNKADYFMRIFNSDGSEAEMCGNGIRCFAKHLWDKKLTDKQNVPIESKVTVHNCQLFFDEDNKVSEVEVSMGPAMFDRKDIGMTGEGEFVQQPIERDKISFTATAVSMGNPHLIIFETKSIAEAKEIGPIFEDHPLFPKKTNVEFVEHLGDQHLKVVVFERGAGITLACGTGACAVAAAASRENRVDRTKPVRVDLPGGPLTIRFDDEINEVFMRGPAVKSFEGTVIL